jgi:hypothetical protein
MPRNGAEYPAVHGRQVLFESANRSPEYVPYGHFTQLLPTRKEPLPHDIGSSQYRVCQKSTAFTPQSRR